MIRNAKVRDYPHARSLRPGERAGPTNGPDFCVHGTPMTLGCIECDKVCWRGYLEERRET